MTTQQLKLTQIKANQWNCNYLGPKETQALKQHMQKDGPQQTLPIVVRKTHNDNQNDEDSQQQEQYYEIVDGEHRWAIARELGWETINAIERDVDDQQSKSLCITYNRIRGRLNWIKLYDIIKKDQTTGINITQAYKEALTDKEIEWLLALDNLIPQARTVLEEALKKHPEYTLEQLYMLSLFPPAQQESLMEKFKTPLILQSLKQILTPFLQQSPQPQQNTQLEKLLASNKPPFTNNPHHTTNTNQQHQTGENNNEADTQPTIPYDPIDQDLSELNKPQSTHTYTTPTTQATTTDPTNTNGAIEQGYSSSGEKEKKKKTQTALLVAVSYNCDCGCHYSVNFKKATIVVQKQDQFYNYVDITPRTLQVHCEICNTDHEYTTEGTEKETVQIFCRRCKPQPRTGTLNTHTGETTWHGNNPYQQ